jgi:nucleoside-diphosphate-sugar epimerase
MANPGNPEYPSDYSYSSADWNVTSKPDAAGAFPEPSGLHGYLYSKLMAEKAAWDFQAEDCSFDVACINPPMVIGKNFNVPKSVEDLNTSSAAVLNILCGKQAPKPHSNGWVHVSDVARAHISAYEHPEAGGQRFLCATTAATWTEVAECLKDLYPSYPVITKAPADGAGNRWSLDTSGLAALSGFQFTPLREALKSQAESLIELGFAKV